MIISYRAILTYIKRLYDASCAYEMKDYTQCLQRLLVDAPRTLYEVMELCVIFLNMEEIGALRARSLGRIDQIYYPYYENDLKNGTYSLEEIKEMLRYHDYAENKYTVNGNWKNSGKDPRARKERN